MNLLSELMREFILQGRKKLLWVFVLTMAHQILTLAPTIFLGKIVDSISSTSQSDLAVSIILFFLSAIMACFIWPIQLRLICDIYHRTTASMGIRWCLDLILKDAPFFLKNRVGEILRVFDRALQDFPWAQQHVVELIIFHAVKILLITGYMIYLDARWELALLMLFFILNILFSSAIVRMQRPVIQNTLKAQEKISGAQEELVGAMKSIQFLQAQKTATQSLNQAFDQAGKHEIKLAFIASLLTSLTAISSGMFVFIIILVSILSGSGLSGGDYVPLFVFASEALSMSLGIVNAKADLEIFKEKTKKFQDIRFIASRRSKISTKDVFSYDITISPFQKDLYDKSILTCQKKIEIPQGSSVAIIGASGQGKTTLARMLCGILWSKGALYVDQYDVCQLSRQNLNEMMYFAEEKSVFLHEDFIQAVFYGQSFSKYDVDKLFSMLKLNHLKHIDLAKEFPKKDLSTGEKKRFGLMRAIALSRPITILDEPTESINPSFTGSLWKVLFDQFGSSTLICLTHDTQAIQHFDIVIEIRDHEIHQIL